MVTKSQEFLRNFRIPKNSEEFCGEKFLGIYSEFLETEPQNCDPTNIYHLRDQFWGIFENFRGISYRKGFSRNSLGILPKKSPQFENLGKLLTFVTWELIKSVHLTYRSCAYDLQKVYIQPTIDGTIWTTKSVHPTYKKCTYDLQKVYIRPTKSVYRT